MNHKNSRMRTRYSSIFGIFLFAIAAIVSSCKVKFEERHGNVYLLFAYYVLESPVMKPKKLESDSDFKEYIGPLLVNLMSGNLEQDIIDESGTDDSKESDLQWWVYKKSTAVH